jgi:hypothetical protein
MAAAKSSKANLLTALLPTDVTTTIPRSEGAAASAH